MISDKPEDGESAPDDAWALTLRLSALLRQADVLPDEASAFEGQDVPLRDAAVATDHLQQLEEHQGLVLLERALRRLRALRPRGSVVPYLRPPTSGRALRPRPAIRTRGSVVPYLIAKRRAAEIEG